MFRQTITPENDEVDKKFNFVVCEKKILLLENNNNNNNKKNKNTNIFQFNSI